MTKQERATLMRNILTMVIVAAIMVTLVALSGR